MTEYTPLGVFADVTLGKMLQTSQKEDNEVRIPYLRAAHVQPAGKLDLTVSAKEMWFSPREQHALDLRAGDVLVVEGGAVGRSAYLAEDMPELGFQNALIRLRPRDESDGRYLDYCLQSAVVDGVVAAYCSTVSIAHFTAEKVGRFRIPYHRESEQSAIADYLDRETGGIDVMIAKLNEMTESLEARKIAVVQRETQLNANGDRWEVLPTAHLFDSIGSGTTPKDREYYTTGKDGIPWVTTSELRENEVFDTNQHVTRAAIEEISSLKVHPRGAVVIAMYGATIGRLGVLGVDAAMNQACCAFSRPREVDARFFYYALWGQRSDIILQAVGGGQPNISQTMLRRWRVPRPPLDTQRRIAEYLDKATSRIDAMLTKVADLKSLLLERRAALITDVVTGRKEVA